MTPRTLLATCGLLAALALAAPTTSGAATAFKPCSGTFDPQGHAGGGFYRAIRAKGIGCSTARAVTQAWVVKHKSGSTNPTNKSIVKGYTCTGTFSTAVDADGLLKILCVRAGGTKAVRFQGSP